MNSYYDLASLSEASYVLLSEIGMLSNDAAIKAALQPPPLKVNRISNVNSLPRRQRTSLPTGASLPTRPMTQTPIIHPHCLKANPHPIRNMSWLSEARKG